MDSYDGAGLGDANRGSGPTAGAGGGCPISRRRFLQGLGAGAAATTVSMAPMGPAMSPAMGSVMMSPAAAALGAGPQAPPSSSGATFGRLFPTLAPFAQPGPALTESLLDIGRPGGVLDADDDLSAGPLALIVDPALSVGNPNSSSMPAGMTFFGQFLDHDVTFDVGSTLDVPADVAQSINGRTPQLDLDSVYGAGPVLSAHLYDPTDKAKLRVESGGLFEDVPRAADMTAIIADPRNDEHVVISGIQSAFLRFHNRVVDTVRFDQKRRPPDFAKARQLTTWHYQWLIVHEILPAFVGQTMVDDILANGPRTYRPINGAFIPVEFQGAVYRFGHSMVRPSYRGNMAGNADGSPFIGMIFDPAVEDSDDPDDLVGGRRAPRRFVGWQTFFDFGDGEVKPNKAIDTKLSTPLFNLPLSAIATGDAPVVLPQRTLLRHVTWSLPSGQAIAAAMGVPPVTAADLGELSGYGLGLEASTPLFYYALKEAELMEGGARLGPVGGRIVAEVFLGLLASDPTSFVHTKKRWRPTLPTRTGAVTGAFSIVDFLTFAGVDPASRGQ